MRPAHQLQLLAVAAVASAAAARAPWQLPAEAFRLLTASWITNSRGFISDPSEVYSQQSAESLCDCSWRCLSDGNCVSLSFNTATSDCSLNSVRGSLSGLQADPDVQHRIRAKLAVLGDWCEVDQDCSTLVEGAVTCMSKECQCAPGWITAAASATTCLNPNATIISSSTTISIEQASNATSATDPASPGTASTPSASETTTAAGSNSTDTPTASSSQPTATQPPTTETATLTSTQTSSSTTTETTTPTTTEPTTPTTTETTTPTTTETTTPTTTGTTTPTTTETTTETTTPTTTPTTTSATTLSTAAYQFRFESNTAIDGTSYQWTCPPNSAINGLARSGDNAHLREMKCTNFPNRIAFSLNNDVTHTFDATQNGQCGANSVLTGIIDEHDKAHSVDTGVCTQLGPGYQVSCVSGSSYITFTEKDIIYSCPENYLVLKVYRPGDLSPFRCCNINYIG